MGYALTRPSGLLRIAALTAFGTHWLTPRLRTFIDAYPDIAVEPFLTDAVVGIAAERIDLAARFAVRPKGEIVAIRLRKRYRLEFTS